MRDRGLTTAAILAMSLLMAAMPGVVKAPEGGTRLPELSLHSGDLVLRQGTGFWGAVFSRLNSRDRRYSHVGIVVQSQGRWQVVHAEADDFAHEGRVRLDDWSDFAAKARALALLRVDDDRDAGRRIAAAALEMHQARLAFDFRFDLANSGAVYCTELAWRAMLLALGRDPLTSKPVRNGREVVLVENFLLDMPELVMIYESAPAALD